MKLRIRSLETRETLRIEVPTPCSLQQLKQFISQTLPSSSSSTTTNSPDSIQLSLNRKEEILSSSPNEDILESLGITSGDLIFYTLNPTGFSSQTLIPMSFPSQNIKLAIGVDEKVDSGILQQEPRSVESQNPHDVISVDPNSQLKHAHQAESMNLSKEHERSVDNMEIDGVDEVENPGSAVEIVGKSFSVPGFLRRVFTQVLGGGDDGSRSHKLLVTAVHAVLLESGFVGFDMNMKTEINGFQNDWPLDGSRLSLFYTLPEIINDLSSSVDFNNSVVGLKFQNLGKFMMVYGSLNNGSAMRSVQLNEDALVSFLNVVWANCGLRDNIVISEDGHSETWPEKEVFKFWRTVKDSLALPLLIDLCESVGFGLPPCFMRLPTDLKLKILESLPGLDVAKVSCVSPELRYLASSDDLWKQKFVEQFGDAYKSDEKGHWKENFAALWKSQKVRKSASIFEPWRSVHPRRIMDHNPRRFPRWPRIIGGDHDIYPQIPHPYDRGQGINYLSSHVPRCQFGRVHRSELC